ncbi:MAG TPA: CHAD domain-containing protein [Herpetosiphonaceae bacterium]
MSKAKSRKIDLPTLPDQIAALADVASFAGTTELALASRMTLAKHACKLYEHLPGVLSGDDPHDVHQMRVATRRLRASMQSTAVAYQPKIVADLRKRLRSLARSLGEVRDHDVMLIRLRRDAPLLTERARSEVDAAIERLEAEREAAHADLVAELQRKRTARLLRDLNDFLLCPLEDIQASGDGLPLLVRHHAGSAIWHEYEAAEHFETVMPRASSERLHELRIACKHLRYTLELFEPALGTDARKLIKLVEAMQEHLGEIHDADVALAYFAVDDHLIHQATDGHADAHTAIPAAQQPTPDTMQPSEAKSAPPESDGSLVASAADTADPETTEQPSASSARYTDLRLADRARLVEALVPMWQELSSRETRRKLAKLVAGI